MRPVAADEENLQRRRLFRRAIADDERRVPTQEMEQLVSARGVGCMERFLMCMYILRRAAITRRAVKPAQACG